jgi:hypothetical protein
LCLSISDLSSVGFDINSPSIDLLLELGDSIVNLRGLSGGLDGSLLVLELSDLLLSGGDLGGEGVDLLGPGVDESSPVGDLGVVGGNN